jgi:hypothetical protein
MPLMGLKNGIQNAPTIGNGLTYGFRELSLHTTLDHFENVGARINTSISKLNATIAGKHHTIL